MHLSVLTPPILESIVKRNRFVVSILIIALQMSAGASAAWAQQNDGDLTAHQRHGRQLLAQSCGVCHLAPSLHAKTYGPPLNKTSANGNNDIMRTFIMEGTPRMPAFKHYFKPADVDAIIDYVRTVAVPVGTAATR